MPLETIITFPVGITPFTGLTLIEIMLSLPTKIVAPPVTSNVVSTVLMINEAFLEAKR